MRRAGLSLAVLLGLLALLWVLGPDGDVDDGREVEHARDDVCVPAVRREATAREPGVVLRGAADAPPDTEAPAAAGAALALAGVVLDVGGMPTGYAVVHLERDESADGDAPAYRVVQRQRSTPAGTFAFEGLEPGRYIVSALATPGLLSPFASVDLRAGEEGVVLRYRASVSVSVRVEDPQGRPIERAYLHAERTPNGSFAAVAWTNADGLATLRGLDPLAAMRLWVRPPTAEFLPETLDPWTPSDRRVVLRRASSIRGRVLDAGGKPVAGARVEWYEAGEQGRVRTEGDGTFVIPRADASPIRIYALDELGWALQRDGVLVRPGDEPVVLVLPARRTVQLQVAAWPEGAAGVLHLWATSGRDARVARIDTAGHAEASLLVGETYSVWGDGPGENQYVYLPEIRPEEESVTVAILDGEGITVRIDGLPPGHKVSNMAVANDAGIATSARELPEGGVWRTGALPPGHYEVRGYAGREADGGGRFGIKPTHEGTAVAQPGETVVLAWKAVE